MTQTKFSNVEYVKTLIDKGFKELYYHKCIKTWHHIYYFHFKYLHGSNITNRNEAYFQIIRLYKSFPCIDDARAVAHTIKLHGNHFNNLYCNHFVKLCRAITLYHTAQRLSPILNPDSILMKTLGKDIVVDILATHFGHNMFCPYENIIKILNDLIEIKQNQKRGPDSNDRQNL